MFGYFQSGHAFIQSMSTQEPQTVDLTVCLDGFTVSTEETSAAHDNKKSLLVVLGVGVILLGAAAVVFYHRRKGNGHSIS